MTSIAFKAHDNVKGIWYDAGNRVMKVQFPKGTYKYSNVQPEFVTKVEESDNVATTLVELRNTSLYPVEKIA